ncbi:uncharacterized protein LOC121373992 [Gigantopelta aegis]|uniref:uncharacterized protein LOC121373992 n=1 Tax=Gigantopelta aegis TaxID=1735272 RepID=UPI001B88BCC9|nr:uncharacterized protein LOC121373992 [Gigantopelta aegis]
MMLKVAKEAGSSTADEKFEGIKITRWQTLFNVTESMARVNSTLALSVSSIWLGTKIINCFQNDVSLTEEMQDIVTGVIVGIETTAKILRKPLESMYLPLTGTFLAESGITLAIVSVDIHGSQLPTTLQTAQKFLEDDLKQFLSQKKDPPKSWIEQYKKKHHKKMPELTEDEQIIKSMLQAHVRRMGKKKSGDDASIPC